MPSVPFVPPDDYPETPVVGEWYGTADLWTVITDDYVERKSVWWSTSFPGGDVEEQPDIEVTWRRLDDPATAPLTVSPGTNAYTVEDGWFMIAGIDPPEAGCWEVTARYRGAELSYIYRAG